MTKYILHGGNTTDINEDNNSFFRAMTEKLEGQVRVLLVYFAREEEITDEFINEDKRRFLENSENKELVFEVAEQEKLVKQIRESQVIYIRGGCMRPLHEKLSNIQNFKDLFEDKIVGGSSAGCYILAKYYWDNDKKKFAEGLGLLPIKSICHYQPEDDVIINEFPQNSSTLPLLVLPDYKWVIFFN